MQDYFQLMCCATLALVTILIRFLSKPVLLAWQRSRDRCAGLNNNHIDTRHSDFCTALLLDWCRNDSHFMFYTHAHGYFCPSCLLFVIWPTSTHLRSFFWIPAVGNVNFPLHKIYYNSCKHSLCHISIDVKYVYVLCFCSRWLEIIMEDGSVVVRRVIPSDNSCLFNAVG